MVLAGLRLLVISVGFAVAWVLLRCGCVYVCGWIGRALACWLVVLVTLIVLLVVSLVYVWFR